MKLELKHLAVYLPYKLGCYLQGHKDEDDRPIKETILGLYDETEVYVSLNDFDYETYIISDVFPILRPLSDLTKKEYRCLFIGNPLDYKIDELPYKVFAKLLELHFDVFHLIPQGLAIDINTL